MARGPTFLGRKPGPHARKRAPKSTREQVAELLADWQPLDRCHDCYGDAACSHLSHDACRAGARAARATR